MHSAVTEASIQRANAQFWEQMLAMELEPIESWESRCIGADHVMGRCELAGAWTGHVEVRLSKGLAIQATAAMLMQAAEAVQAEDILDATKEIANMIAGTFKSALPRPCTMTVPFAEAVEGDYCGLSRTADSVTVFFRQEAGEFMIRVWEEATEESEQGGPGGFRASENLSAVSV